MRGAIEHRTVIPEEFGVPRVGIEQLRGGDVARNRDIAAAVLNGEARLIREIGTTLRHRNQERR